MTGNLTPDLPACARATLADVARGDASLAAARGALIAALENGSPERAHDAYLALRLWTWRTLDARRRDPELLEWHDVIAASAATMSQRGHVALAARTATLGELVAETLAVDETLRAADVARMPAFARVLRLLASAGDGTSRGVIAAQLGWGSADLTCALNLLTTAGLIERKVRNGEVGFRLTRDGMEECSRHPDGP
jgi:hypothetical protein